MLLGELTWRVQDGAGKSVELSPEKVDLGDFAALLPNQSRTASIPAAALSGIPIMRLSRIVLPYVLATIAVILLVVFLPWMVRPF